MNCVEWARRNDEAPIRFLRKCRDGGLDLGGISHTSRDHYHSPRVGGCFGRAQKCNVCGNSGSMDERNYTHLRRDVPKDFQPFPANPTKIVQEARNFPSPKREFDNKTTPK